MNRADGVMAAAEVCAAYKRAAGGSSTEEQEAATAPGTGRPIEGDCPICFDDLVPGGTTIMVGARPSSAVQFTSPCPVCRSNLPRVIGIEAAGQSCEWCGASAGNIAAVCCAVESGDLLDLRQSRT